MQNFQSKGIKLLKINFTKDKPITRTLQKFICVRDDTGTLWPFLLQFVLLFLIEKMQITCITWICLQCDKDIVCKVFT